MQQLSFFFFRVSSSLECKYVGSLNSQSVWCHGYKVKKGRGRVKAMHLRALLHPASSFKNFSVPGDPQLWCRRISVFLALRPYSLRFSEI